MKQFTKSYRVVQLGTTDVYRIQWWRWGTWYGRAPSWVFYTVRSYYYEGGSHAVVPEFPTLAAAQEYVDRLKIADREAYYRKWNDWREVP